VAITATSSAIRTAIGLRKFSGSSRIVGGGGASTGVGAGGSGTTISRCGFPHLWQKSASGGSSAPQVQKSGIVFARAHFQFAAGGGNEATAESCQTKPGSALEPSVCIHR